MEVGRGGLWLMCPPQVLFIPDRNGDDIPDGEPEVVLDGFTVAKDNYHNFANGLRWGPDGWLYGRCRYSCPGRLGVPGTPDEQRIPMKGGIWRFHPERKIVEVLTHGTTNPWGHDWDQNGEMFFINTVTGHLWHLIPGAHLMDSSTLNPLVYEKLDTIADHYHYDRSGSWTESRDGKANSLGGGHAHIGMMIYQGDQWPEQYRNKLFYRRLASFQCGANHPMTILLCDAGGTHIRFALAKDGLLNGDQQKYGDYHDFGSVACHFLTSQQEKPEDISELCLAYGGQFVWPITNETIAHVLPNAILTKINDFEANALGIAVAREDGFLRLNETNGPRTEGAARLVIGVGTGLGLAQIIDTPNGPHIQKNHGGHMIPALPNHISAIFLMRFKASNKNSRS